MEQAQRVSKAPLLPGVAEAILDFWELRRPMFIASIAVLLVLVGLFLGREWLTRSVRRLAAVWSPVPTPTFTPILTRTPFVIID